MRNFQAGTVYLVLTGGLAPPPATAVAEAARTWATTIRSSNTAQFKQVESLACPKHLNVN